MPAARRARVVAPGTIAVAPPSRVERHRDQRDRDRSRDRGEGTGPHVTLSDERKSCVSTESAIRMVIATTTTDVVVERPTPSVPPRVVHAEVAADHRDQEAEERRLADAGQEVRTPRPRRAPSVMKNGIGDAEADVADQRRAREAEHERERSRASAS